MKKDLRSIFNKYDLVGLIDTGSPIDEYDSEIELVLERIKSFESLEEGKIVLLSIFEKMFDSEISAGIYEKDLEGMVREIMAVLQTSSKKS